MLQNKMACQLRTPCDPQTPREHGHCIIRHTPNRPLEQIAAETGIPLKRLTKISAPQGDAHAKPEEIAAICRVTRRFGWIRFYAREAGGEFFEVPRVSPDSSKDREMFAHTRESLSAFTALFDELAAIDEDHVIQVEELTKFDERAGDLQGKVARLVAYVYARCQQDARPGSRFQKATA